MIQADDAAQGGEESNPSPTVTEPQAESTEPQPQEAAENNGQPAKTNAERNSLPAENQTSADPMTPLESSESRFVPKVFTHKRPETLEGRLREHIDNLRQIMMDKELLAIASIDQKLNRAYRALWVADSNLLFQTLASLRSRLKELKKKDLPR